jgi:hypothetical protein
MLDRLIYQLRNTILLASPVGKTVDVLFLVDAGLNKKDETFGSIAAYATDTLEISEKDIVWVNSWSEATAVISKFAHINRLVLFVHGVAGQILLGGTNEYVDDLQVPEGPWPTIDEVVIEGCEVGREALRTFAFTTRMRTKRLVAWNMWHGVSNDRVKPGTKVQTIQAQLTTFKNYLMPGTPDAATIEAQANKKKGQKNMRNRVRFVGREWLRDQYEPDEDVPVPPASRKGFHTRSEAVNNAETITTAVEAAEFTEEEEAPAGREPKQVIIEPAE